MLGNAMKTKLMGNAGLPFSVVAAWPGFMGIFYHFMVISHMLHEASCAIMSKELWPKKHTLNCSSFCNYVVGKKYRLCRTSIYMQYITSKAVELDLIIST